MPRRMPRHPPSSAPASRPPDAERVSEPSRILARVTRERAHGIGVLQGTALYVAAILGSGLLVLPGLAARAAGPASIVGVCAVILLAVPLAGTFAALASQYPDPGG